MRHLVFVAACVAAKTSPHPTTLAPEGVEIDALDGHGNAVDWWAIIKLPSQVTTAAGKKVQSHCDCPTPACSSDASRASGLCYLYADSKNATFRYFRDLGYGCLGQGGNDPLSQTIKQKQMAPYWAYYNDQFYAIAAGASASRQCSGTSAFNAHAKGMVAFDAVTGGFALQSSIPNFPDPSPPPATDAFVPLGCQDENNVQYSQHLFAMSLGPEGIERLGHGLQAARVCSANFYKADAAFMASASLAAAAVPASVQSMADALTKPKLARTASKTLAYTTKAGSPVTSVFKAGTDALPPWALAAHALQTDVSAATWWDGAYGTPTLCAGDVYADAPLGFCLQSPLALGTDGTFAYNVENLVSATFPLPSGDVSWSLLGGVGAGGNHAKWGLSTPRAAKAGEAQLSVFADLNMEGFPCSGSCSGSQGGRGGAFHALSVPALHDSLASLVSSVCSCEPAKNTTYLEARMCGSGCTKKMTASFTAKELPTLRTSVSYWSKNAAYARNVTRT
ncbi:hypothetical protein ACHHYP_09047 [Achlya hypogyna]|uniref:Secreted protein n=1 Tax=Achlya hypogyna TaxID=1202772 RepID=A0A1V9ZJK0_ACHHY|nr:hypothetical protein ACHHYP_09047 [Achlya hypogyna]